MFTRWKTSDGGLLDKYDRPSKKKIQAFEKIRQEMEDLGGKDLRVTGGNSYHFSCAYSVKDKAGRDWLIYHAPTTVIAVAY